MIKTKHIIRAFFVTIVLAGTLLFFRSAARPAVPGDSSCKEALEARQKQENSQKMIWETLSQQFFSAI